MPKPRGLRSGPLPDPRRPRDWSPMPVERLAPFVFVRHLEGEADVLIAPFPKRRKGPTPAEVGVVQDVAERLARDHRPAGLAAGTFWIDPASGTVTPAAIGEGQLRRRLTDYASFNVRVPAAAPRTGPLQRKRPSGSAL